MSGEIGIPRPSAVILGQKDTLEEEAVRFARMPIAQGVFLNSVPKSGTHLLRNIVRMFVPVEQHWRGDFIQIPNLHLCRAAFAPERPLLSWGHLLFSDDSAALVQKVRHVLLVRDPYDWVLARARFFLSEEFQGPLNNIKNGAVPIEDVLNMMIMGVHQKAPGLLDIYIHNAAAWVGTRARFVKYEDLVAHLRAIDGVDGEAFFRGLLGYCGVDPLPADWRERVLVGSDRKQSRTARENLQVAVEVPEVLPPAQRRLVDVIAPGLRALLGYA